MDRIGHCHQSHPLVAQILILDHGFLLSVLTLNFLKGLTVLPRPNEVTRSGEFRPDGATVQLSLLPVLG